MEHVGLFEGAILYGSEVIIHHDDLGDISGDALIPNFKSASFSPFGIVEDIAAVIALDRLRMRLGESA